jgi:hypothetical protein
MPLDLKLARLHRVTQVADAVDDLLRRALVAPGDRLALERARLEVLRRAVPGANWLEPLPQEGPSA